MRPTKKGILTLLCAGLFLFYLLPLLFGWLWQSGGLRPTVLLLLLLDPLFFLFSGVVFSLRHGFWWPLPLLLGALFTPSLFLFWNETGAVYVLVYMGLALLGDFAGLLFKKPEKNRR
ncbi:MAG: hypothetical protein IJP03_00565 [Christensenellaceae bacterium]|nr:hypothetical protein [Christensenellaceae bacterium]